MNCELNSGDKRRPRRQHFASTIDIVQSLHDPFDFDSRMEVDPGVTYHVSKSSHRSRRAATAKLDRLWDNAVIPYEVEANFSGENIIL